MLTQNRLKDDIEFDGECFRAVPGLSGYFVSASGRVCSTRRNKKAPIPKLRSQFDRRGYLGVSSCIDHTIKKHCVHRLVAIAWIGQPPHADSQVNHKNGLKNDNRADNLEWVSPSENARHWINLSDGGHRGERSPMAKLTDSQVIQAKRIYKNGGTSLNKLGQMFGVDRKAITRAVYGETFSYLKP